MWRERGSLYFARSASSVWISSGVIYFGAILVMATFEGMSWHSFYARFGEMSVGERKICRRLTRGLSRSSSNERWEDGKEKTCRSREISGKAVDVLKNSCKMRSVRIPVPQSGQRLPVPLKRSLKKWVPFFENWHSIENGHKCKSY